MALQNWFLPHKETHKKAHLISWEALLFYILFFILLQIGFSLISYSRPGLLGISSNIDQKVVIELTNKERVKKGLSPVEENGALNKAAALKAQNMFKENYWAHFAPSGKSPWDFILGSGYKFTFAGENLAKNFYSSSDVVSAWMASPTHRDNLLNERYEDIGVAVIEGILNGQRTTLIVQEFGTTQVFAKAPSISVAGTDINIPKSEYNSKPQLLGSIQTPKIAPAVIDPYKVYKMAGLSAVSVIGILLVLDALALYKRKVFRFGSHHIAHMALFSITATGLLTANPGSVLGDTMPAGDPIPLTEIRTIVSSYLIQPGSATISILIIAILIYLSWAFIYHHKDKSLTLVTYLEYLLTAILALVLLAGLFI